MTFDGTNIKLYKNGSQIDSAAGTTTTGSTTLYIGDNQGTSSSFNGTIDEVRYYNSDMSAGKTFNGIPYMKQLYNNYGARIIPDRLHQYHAHYHYLQRYARTAIPRIAAKRPLHSLTPGHYTQGSPSPEAPASVPTAQTRPAVAPPHGPPPAST